MIRDILKGLSPTKLRVACSISGGVDSCVAAILLKQRGFDVIGVYMKNWLDEDTKGVCLSDKERDDAKFVCHKLNVPFIQLDFISNYWNHVFSYLLDNYTNGLTPNPDVLCNKHIKFGSFLQYARQHLDVDLIATGHYAGTSNGHLGQHWNEDTHHHVQLLRAKDMRKDQTLFLSQINQSSLQRVIFPLEHLMRSEVEQIAIENGFERIAQKRKSTGICFVGKRNFKKFIEDFVDPKHGNFIDIDSGKIVGQHKGIHYWTIGERCKIAGMKTRYFVAKKILETNDIFVANHSNHSSLYHTSFITDIPHWINQEPSELQKMLPFQCQFKFQQPEQPEPSVITKLPKGHLHFQLSSPKRALTQGQFAVIYHQNECLGSAMILDIK